MFEVLKQVVLENFHNLMKHLCDRAKEMTKDVDSMSDLKQAETFESLVIFLNDVLTVIKMYDEEFTPFVIAWVKENTDS